MLIVANIYLNNTRIEQAEQGTLDEELDSRLKGTNNLYYSLLRCALKKREIYKNTKM